MRIFSILAILALAMSLMPSPSSASDIRQETVRFAPGTSGTTINGRIAGRESVSYVVGAKAGQHMRLSLSADNNATYFNVYEPGRGPGDAALAAGDLTGTYMPDINRFDGVLPSSGNYIVSVYLFRSAARRNERSNFTLEVSIGGASGSTQKPAAKGDFADGLSGGPDYWEVTGVKDNDLLNLRSSADTHSRVLARFANGSVLINRGCKLEGSQRWCSVEAADGSSISGWVNGRYLRESSYAGVQDGGDALVAGTPYNATGNLTCLIGGGNVATDCGFGVIRYGNGTADVEVTRPDGSSVTIHFVEGDVVGYERHHHGPGGFASEHVDDVTVVTIGADRYELVDAIIYGG